MNKKSSLKRKINISTLKKVIFLLKQHNIIDFFINLKLIRY